MFITRAAIANPVAVISAMLLVILFGIIALTRLPIQLIPNVEQPLIQISTSWRAAAPAEVEAEILEPQEDALRGVPGLKKMESSASRGRSSINLTFAVDIDLQRALIEVMNRLNRVPNYPADADEPVIYVGESQFGAAIAWFALRPQDGVNRDMSEYQDFVEDVIQTRIERVKGISKTDAYGGRAREVRITFDPYLAAAYGIDIPSLARTASNNTDISGGFSDIGRRQYTVRYTGKYQLHEFGDMVLSWREGNPVRLRDIAEIEMVLTDKTGTMRQNGEPAIAFNAQPAENVNVLKVMTELKQAIAELNDGPVGNAGLEIVQVYDETIYIKQSIAMLRNNLILGIMLSIGVLWWFMRRLRVTMIVAIAIPVSLFASFALLDAGGRTLNIISLAGLAFAIGMVLDAAIIVMENIVRLRETGRTSEEASIVGTTQVWGALLASTVTTVAIFLPVVFLRDTAGQLFSDMAYAISMAIIVSLVIAVTLIPKAANYWMRDVELRDPHKAWWAKGSALIMDLTDTPKRRYTWIIVLVGVAAGLSWWLKPAADYLPQGRQNWIFAYIMPPPGQGVETAEEEFVDVVSERMKPFLSGERQPQIENYFMGIFGRRGFMGVRAKDPDDVDELLTILNEEILFGFPDTLAFASRPSIFRRLGGGREIDVNIQSRDMDAMLDAALAGMGAITKALPGSQVRPIPGVELAEPELRLIPDERRIAEAGWSRNTMASVIRALGDGLYVGDYFDGDRRRDIILRAKPWASPEELASIPLFTPAGGIQQVGELVRMERTAGPNQIRRVDRRRTITLRVTPPDISLTDAIAIIKQEAEPAILAQLPDDGEIYYYGSADNLKVALASLASSFALAVAILYLLMSALFRSFKDSLLALLAIPLATVGGILALRISNLFSFQPMDLLTMIGFIILLGLVVNNSILLVYQTRASERIGMDRRSAVEKAVRIRLRPILMSTITTLFGMLPMALIPGPGTEIYRGMAAVIVGGMAVSTVFTLILLPSLLRVGEEKTMLGTEPGSGLQGQYAQKHSDI